MSNSDLVFVAKRVDGLGERLRALLNAMALSEMYGGRFCFHWPSKGSDKEWHSLGGVEEFFSEGFVSRYHLDSLAVLQGVNDVREFFDSGNAGVYNCNQSVSKELFRSPEEFKRFEDLLVLAYSKMEFSFEVERAIRAAESISIPDESCALHLRAGDLIYGRFKASLIHCGKAMPFPLAVKIIEEVRQEDGRNILVFGQDPQLIEGLTKKYGVCSSTGLMPDGYTNIQQSFFDIVLMSKCSRIYAGTSGFSVFSARISKAKLVDFRQLFPDKDVPKIVFEILSASQGLPDWGCSPEQVAYACKLGLLHSHKALTNEQFNLLLRWGKAADPSNVVFDFFFCWQAYAENRLNDAQVILLEKLFCEGCSFEDFLKINLRNEKHRKIFRKHFPKETLAPYLSCELTSRLYRKLY